MTPTSTSTPTATPAVTLRRAEALVGLPYVEGSFDCMHLAVLAQRELFGRVVAWPDARRHPAGRRTMAAAIARHRETVADPVARPAAGDAVLFLQRVHGEVQWHVGTLLTDAAGCLWVLHASAAAGASLLETLADCVAAGFAVEGFYRWRLAAEGTESAPAGADGAGDE